MMDLGWVDSVGVLTKLRYFRENSLRNTVGRSDHLESLLFFSRIIDEIRGVVAPAFDACRGSAGCDVFGTEHVPVR
jgi:hypothetical protein